MRILIVENEKPAAESIIRLLKRINNKVEILDVTETIEDTVNRLQEKPIPDLILMDIQLDDGLCFEIFDTIHITIPVIFITAYDKYTLRAFKVNSIDYLLKPVDEAELSLALNKYNNLYTIHNSNKNRFTELADSFEFRYKSRFLIKIGSRFRSVPVNEISYFYINERSTFLRTFRGKAYALDHSLEKIQSMLDTRIFYRINRECIININAVEDMYSYSYSRLQLHIVNEDKNELFVISRDKVKEFKHWIDR